MPIYKKKLKIPYYDVDKDKKVTPIAILRYLNEISANHNDETIDSDRLESRGYGWMINKWKAEIIRYPKLYEEIKIETWISKAKRFFVNREIKIEDSSGRTLVKATGQWIFMDMGKRRPIRLEEEFFKKNKLLDKSHFKKFTRFKSDLGIEDVETYKVRRLDIDMNNHVNNVNYFIWMLEAIEDEIFENYELEKFEIDYKNEVIYPSNIISSKKNIENQKDITIIHGIYNEENREENALGKTKWVIKA